MSILYKELGFYNQCGLCKDVDRLGIAVDFLDGICSWNSAVADIYDGLSVSSFLVMKTQMSFQDFWISCKTNGI